MVDMPMSQKITHTGLDDDIIRQRNYTRDELIALGYEYFERIKEVTMVRQLSPEEAPKSMKTEWGEMLTAQAGYYICYQPGSTVHSTLDEYHHWPVEPSIFERTYRRWDQSWRPTPTQHHLLKLGCQPYYKASGVWAKKLDEPVLLQSLEHAEPVKVQTGMYVAIGVDGEPYSMGETTILDRYQKPGRSQVLRIIKRFLGL